MFHWMNSLVVVIGSDPLPYTMTSLCVLFKSIFVARKSLAIILSFLSGFSFFQGDLGAIGEQYDVAISTACGALDSIIVDTMDTAVKCVDFLRKQDVGVATFVGLDKMERWKKEAHSKISTYALPNLAPTKVYSEGRFL